jgi:hypothetical protein
MRNLFLFTLMFFAMNSWAQITITAADMAMPNDTFRMSTAANPQIYNFELTDSNYFWDFSGLMATDQRLDHYVSINATPLIYNLVFLYPSVASVAAQRPPAQIATVAINNGFNFFKTSNSKFAEVGFGAEVQGSPIPVKYKSEDVIYQLPLHYGLIDSSLAKWDLSIPSLGSIDETRHRVNEVDGWGTIKTPYGTFPCLRVKSTVIQIDTVIYNAAPFPLPPMMMQFTEYIWLTNGMGHPIVKATMRQQNIEVDFMDSIKSFTGFNDNQLISNEFRISPNPATNAFQIISEYNFENIEYEIISSDGKIVLKNIIRSNINIVLNNLSEGLYFVKLRTNNQTIIKKLIIN